MPQSLGEQLAYNLAQEKSNTAAAAGNAALHTSPEALAKLTTVARFFESARSFFEQSIPAGVPQRKLHIVVGTTSPGCGQHQDVYTALEMWSTTTDEPRIVQSSHWLHALWSDFLFWANSVGLQPVWTYCWDGGGMHSWYQLSVKPLPSTR